MQFFRQRRCRWPLGAILFCALPAAAADAAGLETVTVTASREERPPGELAAAISFVSEGELLQANAVHVSEALARVPGVWISRGNGQEHLTAIRSPVLTGAGSCGAFTIAEDGVPVRPTGFCNVNQLFDINTEQAQRVEVLRGSAAVLYGSDAQHGVINVLSKAPAERRDSRLALEFGSNDYRRLKASYSHAAAAQGLRISFNGTRDGGFKDAAGFDQQKFSARHDYFQHGFSTQTLLSITNLNQETAGYVYGEGAFRDASRKDENPNPEAFRDSYSARLQTRIEVPVGEAGSWLLTPYARYSDMTFRMHFLPGTPLEENGQRSAGLQSAYRQSVTPELALTAGLDLEVTDAWLRQAQEVGFSVFPAGLQYDYRVDAAAASAFASSDYLLSETSRLTLGARYEFVRYDYDNRMRDGDTAADGSVCISSFTGAEGCRYSRPADRTDAFDNINLEAGLVHEFAARLSGVARVARGLRAPQATELYRLQSGQVRADLDSEIIDSAELGLRGAGERLQASLTGFYMEKQRVIFQSSDRLNLSNGATRHYGIEYDLDWQLHPHWRLGLAGTFARHLYTSNVTAPGSSRLIESAGNDIDTAPRRIYSSRIVWTPSDATRAELLWQHMGDYFTDIDNEHRYGGHDLLSLRLRQRLTERLEAGLRVRNLADADYAERADYSSLGGGDRYFIGEPRSVFIDLNLAL